jgi:hypothetical protein
VNQILGAGGTATLASATITGALTANGGVNLANATAINFGGLLTIYSDTAAGLFIRGRTTGGTTFQTQDGTNPLLNITNAGVFTFSDGAGGTRMTLNATGLGVGVVPVSGSGKFQTVGGAAYSGEFDIISALTNVSPALSAAKGVLLGYNNTSNNGIISAAYGSGTEGLQFWTHNSSSWGARMTLDSSGRLLVGSTSAFTDLTGSKEVKIGDSGMQTLTVASLPAATATNIARGGVGGLVYVGAYNGTGQYGAVVLWTAASATVVSVINGTGSTITFGVSGGFLQITSSLALTTVGANCIRL